MEKYEALEMEVIRFEAEDVICTSSGLSLSCGKEDAIMEKYEALEMEVIRFEAEDVICESQRWPTK